MAASLGRVYCCEMDAASPSTLVAPTPPDTIPIRRASTAAGQLHRLASVFLLGTIILGAILIGLQLRFLAFRASERVHYLPDIDNAFLQGTSALRQGFLNAYDGEYARNGKTGLYDLDYAPARLAIATLWTRWVRTQVDGPPPDWRLIADWPVDFYHRARQLNRTYFLCRPLLWFNDCMEIAGAAAVFALVRRWTIGRSGATRATTLAVVASLFFWFNPALIWDAHCWPQWDCWLLPFFLWALVAASDGWWFTAGMLIGAATLFKAQILLGAPLLILWPLMRGQLPAAARCVCGFAGVLTLLAAPWLVRVDHATSLAAITWVAGVGAAILLLAGLPQSTMNRPASAGILAAAVLLVCWPLWRMGAAWLLGGVAAVAVIAAALRTCSPGAARHLVIASLAAALLLCMPVFGASLAWMRVGMFGGGQSTLNMSLGPNPNLATLLESQYGWEVMDPVLTLPPGRTARAVGAVAAALDRRFAYPPDGAIGIPIKYLLGLTYVLLLLACAAAAAMHASRENPRFLLAVATPWVLMYAVLPHMHERYMVFGAAIGAITVALSPGWALLNIFLSVVALGSMMVANGSATFHHMPIVRWFDGWTPGVGWAVLLAAAVMLYGALVPSRRETSIPRRVGTPSP